MCQKDLNVLEQAVNLCLIKKAILTPQASELMQAFREVFENEHYSEDQVLGTCSSKFGKDGGDYIFQHIKSARDQVLQSKTLQHRVGGNGNGELSDSSCQSQSRSKPSEAVLQRHRLFMMDIVNKAKDDNLTITDLEFENFYELWLGFENLPSREQFESLRKTLRELYGMRGEEIFRAIRKANDDVRKVQSTKRSAPMEAPSSSSSTSSSSTASSTSSSDSANKRTRSDSTSSVSDKIDHLIASINNFPLSESWYLYVLEEHRDMAKKIALELDWTWTNELQGKLAQAHCLYLYQVFLLVQSVLRKNMSLSSPIATNILPTELIDGVWKEHLYRTNSYLQCQEILFGSQWREAVLERSPKHQKTLSIHQMEEGYGLLFQHMTKCFPQRSSSSTPTISPSGSPTLSNHQFTQMHQLHQLHQNPSKKKVVSISPPSVDKDDDDLHDLGADVEMGNVHAGQQPQVFAAIRDHYLFQCNTL